MKNEPAASKTQTDNSALLPEDSTTTSNSFEMLLPQLQRAVAAEGYVKPTPVQDQCIPHILEGRDLQGCAQTGTGKSAAFILPILHHLGLRKTMRKKGSPSTLIMAPTRELAAQIGESIKTYGKFLGLRHTTIHGGVKQTHQVKALNRGVDILVATPGRLLDLMKQGHVKLNGVDTFVLDEMDRMLDMGFIPDIKRVMKTIPPDRQTVFFSATMPAKMQDLAGDMLSNPVRISIAPQEITVEKIDQRVYFVGKENKDALLISLLNKPEIDKALVFIQMKHMANRVLKKLKTAGIRGTAFHGNISQAGRSKALKGFKDGKFQVMVATDVAARGLDIDNISHVINYDLPGEAETYVHRIGRTARAGAEGDAISFCSAQDRSSLRGIERMLGQPVAADKDHDFHCEKAFNSTGKKPRKKGSQRYRKNGKRRFQSRRR